MPKPVPIKLDPVIDVTPEVADYYREACDAWESGEYNADEMADEYPGLTQADACEWSIRGWTIQGWLNLESLLIRLGERVKQLEGQIEFYRQQLRDRYEVLSGDVQ